jgi:hypothetical protein
VDDLVFNQSSLKAHLYQQLHAMRVNIDSLSDRVVTVEGHHTLTLKVCNELQASFNRVKGTYADLIKEARDVNTESRDICLQTKQDLYNQYGSISKKMMEFEQIAVTVKGFQEKQEHDFNHFHKDFHKHENKMNAIIDTVKTRITKLEEIVDNDVVKYGKDIECLKQ